MDWLKPQFLRIQTVNLKEQEMGIKLNLGASPFWSMEGWHTLGHKLTDNTDTAIAGDASDIRLPDESCDFVFCSHVFEHIPHSRLPLVVSKVNRILKPVNKEEANRLFNFSEQNYNRYSYSLLRDENFADRLTKMGISFPDIKV